VGQQDTANLSDLKTAVTMSSFNSLYIRCLPSQEWKCILHIRLKNFLMHY